jgi:hypothetical protein
MFNKLIKWLLWIADGAAPAAPVPAIELHHIIADLGAPAKVKSAHDVAQDYTWFMHMCNTEYAALHDAPSFIFMSHDHQAYIELRPEVAYACMGRN